MTLLPAPRRSDESPLTVLYVVHGHAAERPGGAETYALELHEAARATPHLNPVLLAATGPAGAAKPSPHSGTLVEPVGSDPSQYLFHTDAADYDWFLSTARNKDIYTRHLADFLRAYTPDVVHVQHSLFFGFDLLRQIRRTLPHAAIVYTLHEYLPMCHRDGQLLRSDGRPCAGPKPRDCASCFPEFTPQDFFLRERFVKGALDLVGAFVCPSSFLLEKYAAWGIPREKLILEANGRPHVPRVSSPVDRPRNRVGYFGQFTRYKGADVLMQAVRQIGQDARTATGVMPSVVLHGANLEHAPAAFQQTFRDLLADTTELVRLHGRYRPADLPRLLSDVDWGSSLRSGTRTHRWSSRKRSSTGGRSSAATSAAWPRRSPTAWTVCTFGPGTRATSPRYSNARSTRQVCGSGCPPGSHRSTTSIRTSPT